MRWNIQDRTTGEVITVDNPTTKEGRARLMNTVKAHTTVGRSRKFK